VKLGVYLYPWKANASNGRQRCFSIPSPVGSLMMRARSGALHDYYQHVEFVNLSLAIVVFVVEHRGGVEVDAEN